MSKSYVQYTDAQKAAYYKSLALGAPLKSTRTPVKSYARKPTPAARKPTVFTPTTKRYVRSKNTAAAPRALSGYGSYGKKKDQSVGHKIGSGIGGIIGHGIGKLIKNLTGFGDYSIEQNSMFEGGMSPPQVINSRDNGGFIVRHREYVKDIKATSTFTNESFPLNPGLQSSFPWLAGIADAFEEYEWRGVVAEFVSTSSDAVLSASTNSSLGSVIMATSYGNEPAFTTKAEMLNHEFANSRKPSLSFLHPIECKRDRTPITQLFVRTEPVPTGEDPRLYDLGKFQIATEGMQASGGNCGELWITYELCLYKPRMSAVQYESILSDHFQISGFSNAAPLGTTTVRTTTSSLKGVITNANLYTFPSYVIDGHFLVVIQWRGQTGVTITYPTITAVGGSSILNLWTGNGAFEASSPPSGMPSQPTSMIAFVVNVSGASGGFLLGGTFTLPAGGNLPCDMMVTQLDSNLLNSEDFIDILDQPKETNDFVDNNKVDSLGPIVDNKYDSLSRSVLVDLLSKK